jgi:hypothetical protein
VRRAFVVACLFGCSLNSAGIGEEPPDLTDAVIDTSLGSADTNITIDSAAIFDGDSEDSAVDTSMPVDAPVVMDTKPDTKPDVMPEVDAGCGAPTPTANPCTEIPHREALAVLGAAGQVLDGRADDFCDVPYVDFANSMGVMQVPNPIPMAVRTTMRIRTAWSSFGLHIHLGVTDDKLQVVPNGDVNLWQGDSAEIYVAGHDTLTGQFDNVSKDVGAHQIIYAPPVGGTPARAVFFYPGGPKGGPATDRWLVRTTGTGYEVEIRMPWTDLKSSAMSAPTVGKRIGLAYAFNQKQDGEKAFAVYQTKTSTPFGSCGQPSCDDRFWCTPILNP